MAIKVGGTEVVDNNRQLKNIASVDATTVAALGTAGVGGGSSFDATMSGSVADGKPMILKTDGALEAVGESNTLLDPPQDSMSFNVDSSGFSSGFSSCFHPPTGRTVVMFQDSDDSNKICLYLIDTGDGSSTPTLSSKITLSNSWTGYSGDVAYDPVTQSVLIAWRGTNNQGYLVAVTIPASGTSLSIGSRQNFTGSAITEVNIACATSASTGGSFGTACLCYRGASSPNYGSVHLYNISGTTTLDQRTSSITFNSAVTANPCIEYDPDQERFLITYKDGGDSDKGKAMVVQVTNPTASGSNSISLGSETEFDSNGVKNTKLVYDTTANKMVVLWRRENASGSNDRYYAAVATITASGNSVAFGTSAQISTTNAYSLNAPIAAVFDSDREKILILFGQANAHGAAVLATVSGTSISFGSEDTNISLSTAMQNGFANRLSYDTNDKSTIYVFNISSSHGIGAKIKTQTTATNLTSSNYIGIADAAYTNGQTATVQTLGAIDDAQSSLTIGSKYYVQANGTIGTSAGSPSVEAGLAVSATKLLVKG